jgi:uncharacterized membrane protein YkvA (DUF1232 family)
MLRRAQAANLERARSVGGAAQAAPGTQPSIIAAAHAAAAHAMPAAAAAPSAMRVLSTLRAWARRIQRDALSLWFARSHPQTPWLAKVLGMVVLAYALSPIDLIPDFIPVLGYLDDVLLLPALIWLALRMLPAHVLHDSRQRADAWLAAGGARPRSVAGAVAIVLLWAAALAACAWWLWR